MTIRQWLANLAGEIKANNLDDFQAPKFLYSLSQSIIADFLKK
jgi:hypothetical protein